MPWVPTDVGSGCRAPGKSLLSADMVCLRANASDTRRQGELGCPCPQSIKSVDAPRAARGTAPPLERLQTSFSQATYLVVLADRHTPAGKSGDYPPTGCEIALPICARSRNSALPHPSLGGGVFTFAVAPAFRCDSSEFRGRSAATSVQAGSSNWAANRETIQRLVACPSPWLSWRWWRLG